MSLQNREGGEGGRDSGRNGSGAIHRRSLVWIADQRLESTIFT